MLGENLEQDCKQVSTSGQDRVLKRLCLSDSRGRSNYLKSQWEDHNTFSQVIEERDGDFVNR
jgi:hypothetical protein